MADVTLRDVSPTGYEFQRLHLDDLPRRLSVGELLERRVAADVDAYHREPSTVFRGLVQPADAVRHSDGHRLPAPRRLDASAMAAAAHEALAGGLLRARARGRVHTDPDDVLDLDEVDEVVLELLRPVIARDA